MKSTEKRQVSMHSLIPFGSVEMEEPPLVKTAAAMFRRSCYKYRESAIAGIICAGWDRREGGQVCKGTRVRRVGTRDRRAP